MITFQQGEGLQFQLRQDSSVGECRHVFVLVVRHDPDVNWESAPVGGYREWFERHRLAILGGPGRGNRSDDGDGE
jgi:hypothetical protein